MGRKAVEESNKKGGAKSVLAFLFLPQFRRSFSQFSIIKPIFMRTIAGLFEGAGLLPMNHPATQYGQPGVPKYPFYKLMGEAYYYLKSEKVQSPYKWSIFLSVLIMLFVIIVAFVATTVALASVFMSTASAQLFDHHKGYDSGMSGVPTAPGGPGFNINVTDAGEASASVDYGIMILNKLFREGITGSGGAIQNAFGSLMEIYNSAILMIAGIMLFWAVISIIVDAAKTGSVGGGRHNLVWAPIRIVFALGLLIPLGSSGFSSGQLMVIKLAEWGSNLGTRGWVTYVESVTENYNLIADYNIANPVDKIDAYLRMWTCRATYNAMLQQAKESADMDEFIQGEFSTTNSVTTMAMGNNATRDLCGAVEFFHPSKMPDYDEDNDPAMQSTQKAVHKFQKEMLKAYLAPFFDPGIAGLGGGGLFWIYNTSIQQGYLTQRAKDLGCLIASTEVGPGEDGVDPLTESSYFTNLTPSACDSSYENGAGDGAKGSGAGRLVPVDNSAAILKQMKKDYKEKLGEAHTEALQEYKEKVKNVKPLETLDRGWPAMSLWYMSIASLNVSASSVDRYQVSVKGPNYKDSSASPEFQERLDKVFITYEKWWKRAGNIASTNKIAPNSSGTGVRNDPPIDVSSIKKALGIGAATRAMAGQSAGFFATLTNMMIYPIVGLMGFSVSLSGTYPLAEMAAIGTKMESAALNGYALVTTIQLVGALFGLVPKVSIGIGASAEVDFARVMKWIYDAIAKGPFGSLIESLSNMLMMGSFMYSYYIPLIPFIKVALAVLTWVVAVFEAVVMLPLAALSHITTEGDGLAPNKNAWSAWLSLLLRPILTVIGFVGSMIVLQTMVVYVDAMWYKTIGSVSRAEIGGGQLAGVGAVAATITYVSLMYMIMNSSFKLIDIIPQAMFKYMGGQPDTGMGDQDPAFNMGAQFNQVPGTDDRGIAEQDDHEREEGISKEKDNFVRKKTMFGELRTRKRGVQHRDGGGGGGAMEDLRSK